MRNGTTRTGSHWRLSLVTKPDSGRTGNPSRQALPEGSGADTGADICEVASRADKDALRKFRHRVAVMDMNRLPLRFDYQDQAGDENLYPGGVQLIATCDSKIVGTIRIQYAFARDFGLDADFYRMREFAGLDYPNHVCMMSHLLVDPAWRGGTLGRELCLEAYRRALKENAKSAFLRCSDPLIYYFSTLGFKPYMGKAHHVHYGDVLPMKLDLQDEKYLAMIHSPFLAALRAWKRSRTPEVRIAKE